MCKLKETNKTQWHATKTSGVLYVEVVVEITENFFFPVQLVGFCFVNNVSALHTEQHII